MIVRWLQRNAAVVWLAAIALAGLGARAITTLPSSIYPEMTFPRVAVVARAGQLAPALVEARVTRPLEEALAVVPGVRRVRATTIRGAAALALQLIDTADPLVVEQACRAAIDGVELPRDTRVHVERVLPTSVPVITFNLAAAPGAKVDPRRLRELATLVVRPAFVRVEGVGGVELQGGRDRELQIVIDPVRLAALHLTPSQLATRLEAADQQVAAGRVLEDHQALPIVVDAQAGDLDALRRLPVASGPTGAVALADVAEVVDGSADPEVIVRGPSGESVAVSVARLPGASTPAVVAGVRARAAELRRALPPDVALEPVYDQAALVDASLAGVRDAIAIGLALALIVIAIALRDLRAGLVAALPVPITLLASFGAMRALGVTLNLMSLGGLAIAVGLVIDDAIVVTEGIVARLEQGHPRDEAIALGYRDMFAAVIGTTATTVVVFAPLALLSGLTGAFLGAFALTLAIAVVLSMVLALTLIPLLARWLVARDRPRREVDLGWLLRRRWLALGVVAVLAGAGTLAYHRLATGFLPAMDEGAFVIDFFLPTGTSLEDSDRIGQAIDGVLRASPDVVTFTRRTGSELGPATATQQSRGDIMVALAPRAQRGAITDVIARVRGELAARVPEARFEYVQVLQDVLADLAGEPAPIELRVLGDDPAALATWAAAAGARLARRPELVDLFDGREGQAPLLRATIDPGALARLGLDARTVADDVLIAAQGREVAQVLTPARTLAVALRYPADVRTSADALARSPIAYGGGLVLGDVVTFSRPLAPGVLHRDGLRGALILRAATPDGDLGAAEAAVREAVRGLPLPRGAQLELGGQAAASAAARTQLILVAGLAAVLVLVVLLLQLHALRLALVVLVVAPLSAAGGLIALAITGTPLDLSSLTGLVLLVGLVVKNGILLLEQVQTELAAGAALEAALIAAARRRLRPIVMTTVATLAGLAPLAIGLGAGAELHRPLAIAVIGGLVLALVVTLVVLPGLTLLVLRKQPA